MKKKLFFHASFDNLCRKTRKRRERKKPATIRKWFTQCDTIVVAQYAFLWSIALYLAIYELEIEENADTYS